MISEVPARLRLWPSSPICSAWAMTPFMSIGPCSFSAFFMTGELRLDPAQAREHLVGEGAVTQHLAEPLVDRAVGAVAESGVLEDPHRHLRRDDAGHRADGAVAWQGANVMRPEAASASASARSFARPS
jgi:hypothetical protein